MKINETILASIATTIRGLSMDAINQANQGTLGCPWGVQRYLPIYMVTSSL